MTTQATLSPATHNGRQGGQLSMRQFGQQAENQADQELQLVSFVVGSEEFAVPILSVQEINRMMPITRVPQSPDFVEGVINLRGRIIPVMDLRKRFNMPTIEASQMSRIIVVEVDGRTLGFIVDRVHQVLRIKPSIIEQAPGMVTSVESEYIEGIAKLEDRLLIMVDLHRLFSMKQLAELDRAME